MTPGTPPGAVIAKQDGCLVRPEQEAGDDPALVATADDETCRRAGPSLSGHSIPLVDCCVSVGLMLFRGVWCVPSAPAHDAAFAQCSATAACSRAGWSSRWSGAETCFGSCRGGTRPTLATARRSLPGRDGAPLSRPDPPLPAVDALVDLQSLLPVLRAGCARDVERGGSRHGLRPGLAEFVDSGFGSHPLQRELTARKKEGKTDRRKEPNAAQAPQPARKRQPGL